MQIKQNTKKNPFFLYINSTFASSARFVDKFRRFSEKSTNIVKSVVLIK